MVNKKNYSLLVVILFAIICFMSCYIVIDGRNKEKKILETTTDCVDSVCNCENDKSIAGLYSAEFSYDFEYYDGSIEIETANYQLYLYTDGTYYYHIPDHVDYGEIGNYIIDEGNVILNCFFKHGSDIGIGLDISSKKLTIDDSGNLIDDNPRVTKVNSVTLVKQQSYSDLDNENSLVKDRLTNGQFYNNSDN